MAKVIDVDEYTFARLLAKSASYGTRELGWDALADADLVKVGPKGYIHGWVFVGAPGVGTLVEHARHGRGKVTHVDEHGHVHVDFGGGKRHSFEHAGDTGPGALSPRAKGTDRFSTHLDAATAANRRGDHAAAAHQYRQAAEATTHPHLASEMHQRADAAQAKIPGLRPSTATEFARTDISSAIRSHDREHQDFPDTAARLDELSNGLRSGDVKVPDAANRLDRIVADHAAAHGVDNHTYQRLAMHAHQMRSDPRTGPLMKPPPKPRAARRAARVTPAPAARSKVDDHAAAAEQALRDGNRGAAINHLMAAADAETDKGRAKEYRQRFQALAAEEMHGTRPTRRVAAEVTAERDAARVQRDRAKESKRLTQLALGARMRGDHDQANAHLEAAAALAPDEQTRADLLDARRGTPEHPGPRAADDRARTRRRAAQTPARAAPNATGRAVGGHAALVDELRGMSTRQQAEERLSAIKRPELQALAEHLEIAGARSGSKKDLTDAIVGRTVGARLQSETYRNFRGGASIPGPEARPKGDASQAARRVENVEPEGRRVADNGEILDTGWVPVPQELSSPRSLTPKGPATAAGLREAAEQADIDAGRIRLQRQALEAAPGRGRYGLLSQSQDKQIRDLSRLEDKQRRTAQAHRDAADALRAKAPTPEGRMSWTELSHAATAAHMEGRHEDAARLFEAQAARARAGETGWTLRENIVNGRRRGWTLAGGKDNHAYQDFPSRRAAEEGRRQAAESIATVAEHQAAEHRRQLAVSPARQADHVQQVRDAYRQSATGPGDWASLADIRDQMPHLSRDQQDTALRQLARTDPSAHLIPWDNQKALTGRERAAALRHGGTDAHVLGITPPHAPGRAVAPGAIRDALQRAGTRTEARSRLAGLTKPQLAQLAHDLGISVRAGKKDQILDDLVEGVVGRRLDSEAISRIGQVR